MGTGFGIVLMVLGVAALFGLFDSDDDASGTGTAGASAGNGISLNDSGETLLSGGEGDLIFGGDGADTITSRGGDDQIFGGAGADTINAGSDDDFVVGGKGNDHVILGGGADEYLPFESVNPSAPELNEPDLSSNWTGGHDTIFGNTGHDYIFDDRGENTLYGGAGGDTLIATEHPDSDQKPDALFGGTGYDTLIGDAGDVLSGNQGRDDFVIVTDDFNNDAVTITDFKPGNETVEVDVPADIPGANNFTISLQEVGTDTNIVVNNAVVGVIQNQLGINPADVTLTLS